MDDPAELLRAEFRLGALKHRERRTRVYTKRSPTGTTGIHRKEGLP